MTRSPFDEVEEMLERMSRQMEESVGGTERGSLPVDLRDEADAFVVVTDLPGYGAEDVELQLSGRRLEITAERTHEEETGDADYVRRERTHSTVSRSVRLPADVEEDGVTASLDEGVLTVTLPKRESDEGRQIEIED